MASFPLFGKFNNKNTLKMKAAIIILLIAIFHILPIVGIVLIAINVEPIYHAIGTAIVFMSTLVVGYIHGINKSFG
jgi:hypothetical protein